ncbi:MAG: 2-oxoglutarate ferredoxin oxidoreductase subunit alpha, partial [Candidatus Fonsibacter sp.]
FGKKPDLFESNVRALKAGYNYGNTTEIFQNTYEVTKAKIVPGVYRNITGNQAISLGFVAASELVGKPLFIGSYPITPATEILQELSMYKNFGVKTFQAEDE